MLHGRTFARIAGPLEGPNQLAGYFDVLIPALLALLLRGRLRAVAPALALCICADVLTLSRAGIVAALIASAAVVGLGSSGARLRRYAAVVSATALAAFAALGALGILGRFASFDSPERPTGLGSRAELWRAALLLWRSHPWLGVGGGNFELELPQAGVTDAQTHANSLYLQSLAEGGLVLFAAQVGTLAAALIGLGRGSRAATLALAAFGGTLALTLHQVFDLMTFFPKVGLEWWLVLGAGCAELCVQTRRAKMQAANAAASKASA
jgi:O-antigen ligase